MADAIATPAVATPSTAPAVTPAAAQPATAAPTAAPVNAAATAPSVATPAAEPASAAQASSPAQPATAPARAAEPAKSLIGDREVKPADGTKPDAKPTEPAKPDEPIKYELKLPEGVTVDPAAMEAVTGILGEAKVAPEIAQKLADFHGKALTDAAKAFLQQQTDVWNTTISAWQKEVMADKEIGGNNFPKIKGEIDQGLLTFFNAHGKPDDSPEMKAHDAFVETLKTGGAGSRVPMLKFIHKAVSRGSEGKPVQGNGPSAPRKSAAEVMYPQKQAAE